MSEKTFARFHSLCKNHWLPLICMILIGSASFSQISHDKVKITSSTDAIIVTTMVYELRLDKNNGYAYLSDRNGIPYTSFPLDIQFDLTERRQGDGVVRSWKIKDQRIIITVGVEDLITQELKITCYNDAFAMHIKSVVPNEASGIGVYLFRRNDSGFDMSGWDQYFSPEPDDYFRPDPLIDIRADRDQQWVFAPAPLNLSFKARAGWFSIGILDLPDASIYAFKNKALWLDFSWERLRFQRHQLYQFPGLIFIINKSPWDAVEDYTNFVMQSNGQALTRAKRSPSWWKRPLVSTWGEQRVHQMTGDHPNFTSQWVKDYVIQQQSGLDSLSFNLIIENKWAFNDGEAVPSDRFRDLRTLIDWCHDRGLKVILGWNAWKVEARALPVRMGVIDGEYIDATHPLFESYVDSCCQVLFGDGPDQLDADGLKIDRLFLTRDPSKANYANSTLGIGFREAHRYLQTFYRTAKKYKPDALVISSAIDPHFADVQDMVRINDDWDNKTVREKRARIIMQAMPGMLIDGDGADLPANIALYHYVTSAIYGVPSIQYLTRFHDSAITEEIKDRISNLLKLYQLKPEGRLRFLDYGNWQILNDEDEIVAESLPSGKGLLIFESKDRARLLCSENGNLHIMLDHHELKAILDESNRKMAFSDLGQGLYELKQATPGTVYKLQLRRISTRRRF